MKAVFLIARILLGLLFSVSGLNGFLHFIPMGRMPTGLAGQYIGALSQSHYLTVVFLVELIPGVLLLFNRYVPLALIVLAPVVVNIVLYHVFMEPVGLPLAIVTSILWILVAQNVRSAFVGLFSGADRIVGCKSSVKALDS
jgi:putative oxidoreductase